MRQQQMAHLILVLLMHLDRLLHGRDTLLLKLLYLMYQGVVALLQLRCSCLGILTD